MQSLGSHALYLQGKALADLSRYAEVLVPLDEVVEVDPENVHVRLVQGWCHKRIGRMTWWCMTWRRCWRPTRKTRRCTTIWPAT